jgi:beta-lactamase regulating signal transducer with metallopeptidase domain
MTAADILGGLLRVNLAAGAATLGVIVLRGMVRRPFGARLAYGLWLLPVLAGAAVLAPPRQVVIVQAAPPVFRSAPQVHIPLAAQVQRPLAPAAASPVQPEAAESRPVAAMSLDPLALLVGLWLAGAAGAALIMACLQHRFMRQARRGAVGPAVVGVIAPRIVTPRDFDDKYSRDEQALVLAHEQAHIARQDSRLNGLCAAVQCLCWFNPLIHLAARLMRIDQELACDAAVVTRFPAARRAYAEVLLKAQMAILPLPLGCYWPSNARHPLVERVALLKLRDISRARRWVGAAVLTTLCAGAGLAAWASQPAAVRIRIAAPAPDGRAARLAPVTAVATAASETTPADAGDGSETPAQVQIAPPASAPQSDASADDHGAVVQRILVQGNERIGEGAILSYLAITPGQTVAGAAMEAAAKRLIKTGLMTEVSIKLHDGDLVVRVREKPDVGAEKLLIDLTAGHEAAPGAEANAGAPVPHQTERVEPPVSRLGTVVPSAPVRAIPPAPPVALVTRPADVRKQTDSFVQSYAASTAKLGQIARWGDPLCVQVIGLAPEPAAHIRARIEAVAKGVGQSVLAAGCTPNIEIAFTDQPQSLIDRLAARQEELLGYHHRDVKTLKTVTRPIQAWYVTATVSRGGPNAGALFSSNVAGNRLGANIQTNARVTDDPDNRPPTGCGDSRFSSCLESVFDNVLVVVDTGRVRDKGAGQVSDYVAMLALSQPRSLDGCNVLPSVTDLFAPACPGHVAPDGLTPADAAYLTSLYATDPQARTAGAQSDIAWRMARILVSADMAVKAR